MNVMVRNPARNFFSTISCIMCLITHSLREGLLVCSQGGLGGCPIPSLCPITSPVPISSPHTWIISAPILTQPPIPVPHHCPITTLTRHLPCPVPHTLSLPHPYSTSFLLPIPSLPRSLPVSQPILHCLPHTLPHPRPHPNSPRPCSILLSLPNHQYRRKN